ncbi:MAG: NAD(P)H-dependent glycerol-3-phosphate dehydrogenase [Planctomycetota bacterium]|nr:NAD(P)H-dependent glycerol-3-phosphate dehydrogenase [Planctomycetota bacterium]
MKVAILGNGGFGTAMAIALTRGDHRVSIWGHNKAYTEQVARERHNPRYLDGIEVPESIAIGCDPEAALEGADVVLVAVPTQHIRSVLESMLPALGDQVPLVSLAKGLEQSTGKRPSQVIAELLADDKRALVLSGPSHAEEIARGQPTTVVLAGEDPAAVQSLQEGLTTRELRVYRNGDVRGTELGGALKNVMAIAAGIAEGLGYGDNAKAAILTRGIVEMARYGVAEGADERTFFGLAGIGDLAVTAFSPHGRNRAFGARIGGGMTLDEALAASPKVAEGVWTSRVVAARAQELAVEMPIADAVCQVLFGGLAASDAVRGLMERDPKAEV